MKCYDSAASPKVMRGQASRRPLRVALLALLTANLGACARAVDPLVAPRQSAVALTGGSNTSMIYVARTTDGVLVIDLGWWGYGGPLGRALDSLGAAKTDVNRVFLTHSHRDHLAAWPDLRHARFHVAEPELPLLTGTATHRGWIPRFTERLRASRLPRPGELSVQIFSQDTAFVVGADTLRAYLVAGHTAGSAVYLFRGVLFLGDAITWSRWGGFAPAKRGFSADSRAAADNLALLWPRLPAGAVRYACTAHAHCAAFTSRFLDDVARNE